MPAPHPRRAPPGFAEPYARTTARLRQAHESIGYHLGGEAGARLTTDLSMTTSPDTLLRRDKPLKDDSAAPPRFVGIDTTTGPAAAVGEAVVLRVGPSA